MSSSSSPPPNAEFKAANAAANDPESWRCDECFCRNKKEDIICVVCEAPNPNLSAEDVERLKKKKEEEKNKLISMFHTNDDNNSAAPKPTGFGVSTGAAPPSATTFTFGQPQTTTSPEAGKPFVFGAPTANDAAGSSNAQTISPPSATPSFMFGAPSTTSAGSSANTTPITFGSAPAAAAPAGLGFVPTLGDDKKNDEKLKELSDKPDLENEDLLHLGKHSLSRDGYSSYCSWSGTELFGEIDDIYNSVHAICAVYVHGSGECEQLGLGDAVLERRKPTSIDKICMSTLGYKISVTHIAVGALHTLALDATSGKVFSWGCNDDGALGRLGPENQPRPIDGMEGVAVRSIAAGDNHSTFLDDLGRVWLCGTYKDSAGYLGFPNFIKGMSAEPLKRSYDPVRVPGLGTSTSRAVAIASGANHTVVAVESSRGGRGSTAAKSRILEVYAWGNDEFGQLGHGGVEMRILLEEAVLLKHTRRAKRATSYKLHPHPLSWNKKERGPLDRVYASANCTFLVTEEGKVFGCGLNNFAQLGLGQTTAEPI
ncbi:Regulator of chromosome condensation, partial [Perkinsus olseni]